MRSACLNTHRRLKPAPSVPRAHEDGNAERELTEWDADCGDAARDFAESEPRRMTLRGAIRSASLGEVGGADDVHSESTMELDLGVGSDGMRISSRVRGADDCGSAAAYCRCASGRAWRYRSECEWTLKCQLLATIISKMRLCTKQSLIARLPAMLRASSAPHSPH